MRISHLLDFFNSSFNTTTMNVHSSLSLMRARVGALLFAAACLLLTACASIVGKSHYPVNISSNPPGATFSVKKSNGMLVSTGMTPATVTLPSSFGYFQPAKYIVDFKRNGVTQSIPFDANINGWYFGNLISWGVIAGMLIVDPATGAMWRLDNNVIANFN